jgi:hypothetical protein
VLAPARGASICCGATSRCGSESWKAVKLKMKIVQRTMPAAEKKRNRLGTDTLEELIFCYENSSMFQK